MEVFMQRNRMCFPPVLVTVLLLVVGCGPDREEGQPTLAFQHIGVVDVDSGRVLPDRTVVISGARIIAEGPSGEVQPPRGARTVDGTGRFLIPGLWDMHVHLTSAGRTSLGLLVVNGVTRVRDMGGNLDTIAAYQDAVAAGTPVGPWIVAAGDIVENAVWLSRVASLPLPAIQRFLAENPRYPVATPEEARAAVDSLRRLGADFVKIRTFPPEEAVRALAAEARRHGLRGVAAHVPEGPNALRYAAEAGLSSLEHMDMLSFALDGLTAPEREAQYTAMAQAGTAFTPTVVAGLVRMLGSETIGVLVEDTLGLVDSRRPYLANSLLSFWRLQQELDQFDEPMPWGELLPRDLTFVREMHESGIPILAGTDLGVRLLYPGYDLHTELRLLVEEVGLTAADALKSATVNPARFFAATDSLGAVAPGRVADLVVLEADPLEDIRNLSRIAGVVLRGEYLDRKALDGVLARARS